MGCSASRPVNFITHRRPKRAASNSSSLHPNSQLHSPYDSFSDPSSTPVSRTLSLPTPLVHHPPQGKGDSNHFVALTSTTYGSLVLLHSPSRNPGLNVLDFLNPAAQTGKPQDFDPSEDPPSPDSLINTWELMEGLDEEEFKLHMVGSPESKPLWKHLSEESLLSKTAKASSYRNPLMGRQTVCEIAKESLKSPKKISGSLVSLPGAEDRIVLYYTSLRSIRKTYEDCCTARAILRGFGVLVDERDISMDRSYRAELQESLKGKTVILPQVFLKGKLIGGADEIKKLDEAGDLGRLLADFPVKDTPFSCNICGDARFVPCPNCNGSRKIYRGGEGRCPGCNENGLVRCSGCCP